MVIIPKLRKTDNCASQNPLDLHLLILKVFLENGSESFLESNSPDLHISCEKDLED